MRKCPNLTWLGLLWNLWKPCWDLVWTQWGPIGIMKDPVVEFCKGLTQLKRPLIGPSSLVLKAKRADFSSSPWPVGWCWLTWPLIRSGKQANPHHVTNIHLKMGICLKANFHHLLGKDIHSNIYPKVWLYHKSGQFDWMVNSWSEVSLALS